MEKSLNDKAIDFKGKKYVLISDRVVYFNDEYKNGAITTELISDTKSEMVIVKATITPDIDSPQRVFTGYSQARWGDGYINKTSALENCETSAVGRALGMMGIGVIDSVVSIDEINKAGQDEILRKKLEEATTQLEARAKLGEVTAEELDRAKKIVSKFPDLVARLDKINV